MHLTVHQMTHKVLDLVQKQLLTLSNLNHINIAQMINVDVRIIYNYYPSRIRLLHTIIDCLSQDYKKSLSSDIQFLPEDDRLFEIIITLFEANMSYKRVIIEFSKLILTEPQTFIKLKKRATDNFKEILSDHDLVFLNSFQDHVKFNGLLVVIGVLYYEWLSNDDDDINNLMHKLNISLKYWRKYTVYLH